jgi:predicted kinase
MIPAVPTLHLMCGLVASGKTTLARGLAADLGALRLSRDEWMIRLYGLPHDDPRYVERLDSCTELMWDVAFAVIVTGMDVILDWNFWSRHRRADALARASREGVSVKLHWLDVPVEVAIERAEQRLRDAPPNTHRIDADGVRHFATIFQPPDEQEGLPIVRHT